MPVRRLPIIYLCCFMLCAASLFALCTSNPAAAQTHKVTAVYMASGSFQKIGRERWVERRSNGQIAFRFIEQNRTQRSILLFDSSRNVHIALVIPRREILYSFRGQQFRKIYDITRIIRGGSMIKRPNPKSRPNLRCGKNYNLQNGKCVLLQNCGPNAFRNVEGDCHCKRNYQMRNGRCQWKTDRNGFEIAPWKKPQCIELKRLCNRGIGPDIAKACRHYEEQCQVN